MAEQAQVSVGMLSLIETGKRRPSLKSWGRIRQRLGITEPLPEEAWRQQPREISDELVASLGACLVAVRAATLAELAEAVSVSLSDVRSSVSELSRGSETGPSGPIDGWLATQTVIWTTGDSGRTWQRRSGLPGGWACRALTPVSARVSWCEGVPPDRILPNGRWELFRTTDGGRHWQQAPKPQIA